MRRGLSRPCFLFRRRALPPKNFPKEMKQIFLLLAAFCLSAALHATAPVRRTIQHTQPDGTALTVSSYANGHYALFTADDGTPLFLADDGHYYYARIVGSSLASSGIAAHNAAERSASERARLKALALTAADAQSLLEQEVAAARPAAPASRAAAASNDGLGEYGVSYGYTVSSIGSPVIPVVLAEFADRTFQDTITIDKLTRFFNQEGYADERYAVGSVRDYFVDQSAGLFTPTFKIVARVKLSGGYATYGADRGSTIDYNRSKFVREVLDSASLTVDFAQYKNGESVPLVAIMHAGPGQQSSFEDGCSDYLWARFQQQTYSVNGGNTKISSYLYFDELFQTYGTGRNDITEAHLDGIGLFCHEFGHALGLPDFYYTGSSTAISDTLRTMEYWDIMDYGQYTYNGYRPTGYTAYERSAMGWLKLKELTEADYVTLYPLGEEAKGPTACIIRNPEEEKEYYILENRKSSRWYTATFGVGMLMTHVDYSKNLWSLNQVNNTPAHQRMAFVPADGRKEGHTLKQNDGTTLTTAQFYAAYRADLFPGENDVTQWTSFPVFNGTAGQLDTPLYNIKRAEDGSVSFSFIDATKTGISAATADSADASAPFAYTISGRRVGSLQGAPKGIYILSNGQKVVVK